MSIRFAGSRFVHERRRRRLAQECGGVSVLSVDEEAAAGSDEREADLPPVTTLGHSPVCSIIRPQLWIHWTITVLCLIAWGGMLYLGDLAEQTDLGLRDILGIRSGRVTNFFSTIMLLWAGQLSLLIYWYRRKSRNDFAGRYRVWLWIGGMLQLFLVVAATGAHRPFSQYMQRMWPLDIPAYGLLAWLVPIATLGLAMYRMLRIELKRHCSGKFLLYVAGIAGAVAATSLLLGIFLPERLRDLLQVGSATLAHMSLATALLMHARYVVHISNEVPRRERSTRRILAAIRKATSHLPIPALPRWRPALPKLRLSVPRPALPKLVLPGLRGPLPRIPKSLGLKHKQNESAPAETASGSCVEPPTAPSPRDSASKTPDSSIRTRAVITSRKPKRQPQQPPERHRIDGAETPKGPRRAPDQSLDDILNKYGSDEEIDAETLSGLSKKQRRRLRKKQRELQRTGQ